MLTNSMENLPTSTEFMLMLTLLLASAILASIGIRRIGLPPVIGFIAVGMAVGPYGFALVKDVQLVNILADIGLIILVFVIGLEFNLSRFRKVGGIAIIGALVELGFAFLLTFILSITLGFTPIEALYIGGIISITSTAIVLKLLKDAGIVHTKEAEFILLVSIVEDIFAIVLLVALPGIVKSGTADIAQIAGIVGQSIAFFMITLILGLKAIPKVVGYVSRIDIDEAPFLLALSLGFGLALLANYLGLSMAIGAFLMGVMIASAPRADVITNRILPLRDFFGTIFFISIGMLISVSAMLDNILLALPLICIAVVSKFIGNFISAVIVGFNRDSASTIGVMMMPRGELSFVMAKQGVDVNATREFILPTTMLISLASILVVPLLGKVLPTIVDPKSLIPIRILEALEYPARVVRVAVNILQSKEGSNKMRSMLPRTMINIAIIIAMITIISLADNLLMLLYNTFISLRVVPYNVFKLIFMLGAIVYPLLNTFGNVGYMINSMLESFHARISKAPISNVRLNHMYRIVRNIVMMLFILIVTSFIIPPLVVGSSTDIVLPSSIVALGIFIYLLFDTFVVVNKKIEQSLAEIIFESEENK
jgi:CPA2 family monovalent cation:H+ antiporter-2